MSSNVGGVNSRNNNAEISSAQKRIPEVTVKKGENLTIIAKRFGMTKAEFVKWTGLKGIVYVGQKIKLPAAHVPKGKGIYALAREYNMTMDEFCKLNNIKDRQNYQAKADEFFYVKNKKTEQNPKTSKKTETKPKTTKPSSSTKGIAEAGAMVGKVVGKVINQERWGSAYSPEEIGEKLYELSGKYYGAVGRPDFDALINEINPKNASAVIENYTKNKKNKDKESLILTITHEIKSDKGARKAAVMKVYDALAAEKSAPAEKRKEFEKELNEQFDSWGMVNTKKLDSMIAELLKLPSKSTLNPTTSTASVTKSNAAGSRQISLSKTTQTVASLHNQAINGSINQMQKHFKDFCKSHKLTYSPELLDTTSLTRIPKPVLDKNGHIVPYVSEILKPTGKANGKVIVLNSGHGGYNPNSGGFDVGSFSFVKKGNGKYAPHLEYEKVQPYVHSMAEKLRQQGYAVVLTQGSFKAYSQTKALTHLYNDLASGAKAGGQKYNKKDIAFVSFHADSSNLPDDKNDKSTVCYRPGYPNTEKLAQLINHNLNHYEGSWVQSNLAQRTPGNNGVWVLTESTPQVPAVLLETAHINGVKGRANLDSWQFREQFVDSTILGLNQYFGI